MIEICKDHTGKMEGIQSISTSTLLNPNCRKNAAIEGSICSKCYATNMCEMYSGLRDRLARNTAELTSRVIPMEELPDTTGQEIFRFESFGDLNNEIQLTNYLNIARKNPGTRFTLWTKMYELVYHYFGDHPSVPENFTLILSSLMINVKLDISWIADLYGGTVFRPGQLKVFTVYDKNYIDKHPELVINCGSRCCNKCRNCYNKNKVVEINEILKSDHNAVESIFAFRDPEKRKEVSEKLAEYRSLIDRLEEK